MSMQQHDAMACQELVEVITDYIEGAMSAGDRERFEAHLADCRHCVDYLAQMRTLISILGALSEESVSADVRDELLEAFRGCTGETS